MLSHQETRPDNNYTGSSPVIVRTARRLLTSAINTTREHNLQDQPSPAHRPLGRPKEQRFFNAGGKTPFRVLPAEALQARGRMETIPGSSYHDRSR